MDSSSGRSLSNFLHEITQWRRRKYMFLKGALIHWSEYHLSVVSRYIFRLNCPNNSHVPSFTQELREFFMVPTLRQLSDRDQTLQRNELIAAFLTFLLQLLNPDFVAAFEDEIGNLENELRFLLMAVRDTVMERGDEHEHEHRRQVQDLLAEFEAVANEAGALVHSFFFSTDPLHLTIDVGLDVLSTHMGSLKGNIVAFLETQEKNAPKKKNAAAAAVESLFVVDSLLSDLEDLLMNRDSNRIGDAEGQIRILQEELLSLVNDVKLPRRPCEIQELKEAMLGTRDVAYEAEYLINSFLVGDAPLWYLSIRLPSVIRKIKLIGAMLEGVRINYGNQALQGAAGNFSSQRSLQAKRNSELDDIVVGYEEMPIDILDQLVGRGEQLHIISIFGMPGLGKTTFAKMLYNHSLVKFRFDKQSWCVVSQVYQRRSLLTDILIGLTSESEKDRILNMDEESIAEEIYRCLKGRRYLIVMDDIWDSSAWDDLRRCFPNDSNGSRILFTTRNKDVAPSNSSIYELPSLSNDKCWELLQKKVFHNQPCPPELERIGKEIAAKCLGLPLAVVVIAGIISDMSKEESTWAQVGENIASYMFNGGDSSMTQILELSYMHLPGELKPCFLYIGAFPEDKEIPIQKLMRLWIAEGFISKEGRKSVESVAEEYLMRLLDRSLVMVAKRRADGGVKACVVHDLIRDLCLKIAKEDNFLKLVDDENYSIYEKGHCLLSQQSVTPIGHHARSFHGSDHVLYSPLYIRNMRLIRVLISNSFSDLVGIEYLVLLRYLVIYKWSASIGSLVNLEYLRVERSTQITSVILKMRKLRYLHLGASSFSEDCNISEPNRLEFLSDVSIRNLRDEEMLKCFPNLRKLKCNCGQKLYVKENGARRYPDLGFLTQLESLKITISTELRDINFPSNIKKLTLSWSLPWEKMSMIAGLPNLQVLKLTSRATVGGIWETRHGEFQQLTFLKLEASNLTQWNVESWEHFPKLHRLVLSYCPNLQEIPYDIGDIAALDSIEVYRCSKAVEVSAREIELAQQDLGNYDLKVSIVRM